jgi:hypothetical protein
MKRNYNLRTIKTKKSYSTKELSQLFSVHPQTIRSWRKDGLISIDESSHYALFLGSTVKSFLQAQADSRRVHLKEGEFYCLSCNTATTASNAQIISQEKMIGKGMLSVRHHGNCDKCSKVVNRFGSLQPNEVAGGKVINTGLSASL